MSEADPPPPEAEPSKDVEVVTETNNNKSSKIVIGEPESDNFDIGASIVYSHRYFKKIEGTDTAVCLTCQKHNEGIGPKEPKRKETFSAAGSSTSGNNVKTLIVIFYLFTYMFSQVVERTYSADTRGLFWTNSWLRKRSSIN